MGNPEHVHPFLHTSPGHSCVPLFGAMGAGAVCWGWRCMWGLALFLALHVRGWRFLCRIGAVDFDIWRCMLGLALHVHMNAVKSLQTIQKHGNVHQSCDMALPLAWSLGPTAWICGVLGSQGPNQLKYWVTLTVSGPRLEHGSHARVGPCYDGICGGWACSMI